MMRALSLGLRTYVRYAVPLTLLSLLAFSPLLLLVARVQSPATAAQARDLLRSLWELGALAVVWILVLAGAAAPLVRSSLGQLGAVRAGLRGLVGALLPVFGSLLAVAVGLAALVVPGLILLPLIAYAGACTAPGIAARMSASVAVARAHLPAAVGVIAVVVGMITIGIVVLYLRLPLPLPKKPSLPDLAAFRATLRTAAIGCAFVAPLLASLLAAIPALQAPANPAEVDR
jgi:hypothetical protein